MSSHTKFDILIIGGGINGMGIAALAATHQLKVLVCEQGDLAAATSQYSSKLIHGGLRYLEHGYLSLVQESLKAQKQLQRAAPHLVRPQAFVLPYVNGKRPYWMLKTGLWIYDRLSGNRSLPKSEALNFEAFKSLALKQNIQQGFSYYDCTVDDSRLVVTLALEAKAKAAVIWTQTQVLTGQRHEGHWQVTLEKNGSRHSILAKTIVNASGPWVKEVLEQRLKEQAPFDVRWLRGSHIIVPESNASPFAFTLQNEDERVFFVIPFQGNSLLIGTTETPVTDLQKQTKASSTEDIDYLCKAYNRYFQNPIHKSLILKHYSGVRTLVESKKSKHKNDNSISREYELVLQDQDGQNPVLSVVGGKLTTFTSLAEKAISKLLPYFPDIKRQPFDFSLPGGDLPTADLASYISSLELTYPYLPQSLLTRFAKSYGTRSKIILDGCQNLNDLGQYFGNGLYQKEVDYLVKEEWATKAEDILWRRSKLGLHFHATEIQQLENYILRLLG